MDSDTSEQATPASTHRPTSSRQGSGKHIHSHGPGHKHSKPWTARLYRKHDAKHHRAEPETTPLISDPEPQEETIEPEENGIQQEHDLPQDCEDRIPHYIKWARISGVAPTAVSKIAGLICLTGSSAAHGAKAVTEVVRKGVRAARDHAKRVMAVIIVVLIILLAILGAGLAYDRRKLDPTLAEVCTSPACIRASNYLLKHLDPSLVDQDDNKAVEFKAAGVDPCTEFDRFVCGGFNKAYDLREDQGDMSTDTLIAEDDEFVFKHVVEFPQSKIPSQDANLMKMLKTAYTACMDSARPAGLKPMKDIVDHIKHLIPVAGPARGGPRRLNAPVLESGNVIRGLNEAVAFLLKMGVDALVKLEIIPALAQPDKHIIKLSPVLAIGLPAPDFYRDAGLVTEYRQLATQMLDLFYDVHINASSILGRHRNIRASVLDLAQGVIDMEVKLALALPLPQDLVGAPKLTNEIPVSKIAKMVHQLDLEKIIKDVAPAPYHPDQVYLVSPEYLERLSFVLQATPVEIIQAFMTWKAIQHLSDSVDDPRLEPLKAFKAKVKGAAQEKPNEPWRYCVREVNDMLGWAMSRFFVQRSWDGDKLDISKDVTHRVKQSFTDLLGDLDWMTGKDRDAAIEKTTASQFNIGYPAKFPSISNPSSLEDYYQKMTVTRSHFSNKIEAARFETVKEWSKLVKSSAAQWDIFPDAVGEYYDYPSNKAVFPAGLLQAPMIFDQSVPEYLVYGSLGFLAARNLFHAIGSVGSHFAPDGEFSDGWSNQTRDALDDKSHCFARQYSQLTVDGPNTAYKVNGNSTVDENMADTAGLRAAFVAWQTAGAGKPARALPGLQKFTNDQLFFISFGNGLCSKTSPEKAAQRILTDTFAPKPARILGTVANSKEFKEAFKCPVKNPTCELL